MVRARVLALLLTAVAAAQQSDGAAVAVDAPLWDGRWLPRRLAEFAGSAATVVYFTTIECPISARYLPRLGEFAQQWTERGVRVLVVNCGPGDGLVEAAAQQVELAPAATFAKDFEGGLAQALAVERTATAVVLDGARRVVYRGRVDGQYRYAGATPGRGREDLRLAVEQLLAGAAIEQSTSVVEGCRIERPAAPAAPAVPGHVPTFHRDIAPLLQQHCQDCHRPAGEAPFALLSLADCRAHLQMLGEVVEQQRMPPWYGSRRHGAFVNVRGLRPEERATIALWIAAGAAEGEPADAPPERTFATGEWRLGEPDLVLKVPVPIRVPADGYVPYKYFVLPYRFEHDTWVEAIEIKPEARSSLHHCNLARVAFGEPFSQDGFVTGQVPGGDAMVLDAGTAVRIPAGHVLVLQAHYVTTGEPVVDRLRVGLRFPRVPVDKELRVLIVNNGRFVIPPGAPAHPVRAARTLPADARGIGMFVHMHLRGRDMQVVATPPEGETEKLLVVPNYNFDWQQSYRWARAGRLFAAGTRIEALAHFDNSASNPFNPDPTQTVRFGQETKDEMMYAFLFYTHEREQLGLCVDAKTGWVIE